MLSITAYHAGKYQKEPVQVYNDRGFIKGPELAYDPTDMKSKYPFQLHALKQEIPMAPMCLSHACVQMLQNASMTFHTCDGSKNLLLVQC